MLKIIVILTFYLHLRLRSTLSILIYMTRIHESIRLTPTFCALGRLCFVIVALPEKLHYYLLWRLTYNIKIKCQYFSNLKYSTYAHENLAYHTKMNMFLYFHKKFIVVNAFLTHSDF